MPFTDPDLCTEEAASAWLYLAGRDDPDVQVLSFQAVDGKGYFAPDVKLRLPDGTRVEPDLIVRALESLWLIEVKATHFAAASDEEKLLRLRNELGDDEISAQVGLRSKSDTSGLGVVLAVAFCIDDAVAYECDESILHIDLSTITDTLLGDVLRSL